MNIIWLVAIVAIILGGVALALHLERVDIRRESRLPRVLREHGEAEARRGGDL